MHARYVALSGAVLLRCVTDWPLASLVGEMLILGFQVEADERPRVPLAAFRIPEPAAAVDPVNTRINESHNNIAA